MKIIWVAKTGNDTTGTGSQTEPYLTIDRAIQVFENGDQIRIMDGTYIPTDAVVISGLDGSMFAENPQAVYIQPQKTKNHQACVAIIDADRFSVVGINIIQAADADGNLIGLYVENVENFIAYTCAVSGLESTSGDVYGIFAAGGGRIENCQVSNLAGAGEGNIVYGIKTLGVDIIDCSAAALSGVTGLTSVVGMEYNGFRS